MRERGKAEGVGIWKIEVRIPMDRTMPPVQLDDVYYTRGECTFTTRDYRLVSFHVEKPASELRPRRSRAGKGR